MILVTGANGLSGSIIVREFARQGTRVRALVRNQANAAGLAALPGVEVAIGDMLEPTTFRRALDDVDRALLLSSSGPAMLETQCSFIDVAKSAGVRHIVKFSGRESGVGFDPNNFRFARMHEDIERYLERSGVAWTHLRPSQFMQIYFRELKTIIAESTFYFAMDGARLAPVDIEDVAKVAHAILRDGGHEGESLDMTGPEALTMAEVAERISSAIGRTIRYVNVTPEAKKAALLKAGMPAAHVDALDELFAERRRHPESRVYLGTHEAFGVPPTTFAEFARRNAAVFRGEAAAQPA